MAMYSEYKAYMKMFQPKHQIITEADEDKGLTLDDLDKLEDQVKNQQPEEDQQPDSSSTEPQTETQPPPIEKQQTEKPKSEQKTDMKFSVDLATEFSNTINQFTNVCAQMVEKRIIDKETSDKFYDLYGKIKNLADAASKTE